jgi:PAS domain S-box-containing protein
MDRHDIDSEWFKQLSHATIEQAVDGIFWLDAQGQICRANEAACRLFGYSRDELLGLTIADIDAEMDGEGYWALWEQLKKEKKRRFESCHARKDGHLYPAAVTSFYIECGKMAYSCNFFRDISGLKRAEQAQKEAEDALHQAMCELTALKNRLKEENSYLQEEIRVEHNFEEIIGRSDRLKRVLQKVEQVASTQATVLISGETGTGKELIARAVHHLSHRKDRPLVKVNCAALPANLIESELFGHEKGAFTGALVRKKGRFEMAHRGTIFLDEIGDLPLELQAKLLRVLQEGEFERLGNPGTIQVDVRVIAATNRDLKTFMDRGMFREDLYYRLNVFPIEAPPLRERREDIVALVKHFIRKYRAKSGSRVSVVAEKEMHALQSYRWPGNVRELENIIERALIISPGEQLELEDWLTMESPGAPSGEWISLEENERLHIQKALDATHGRVSGEKGAGKLLGINPKTLRSRMVRLGMIPVKRK